MLPTNITNGKNLCQWHKGNFKRTSYTSTQSADYTRHLTIRLGNNWFNHPRQRRKTNLLWILYPYRMGRIQIENNQFWACVVIYMYNYFRPFCISNGLHFSNNPFSHQLPPILHCSTANCHISMCTYIHLCVLFHILFRRMVYDCTYKC